MSHTCWENKEEIKLACFDLSLFAKKCVKGFICTMSPNAHGSLQGRGTHFSIWSFTEDMGLSKVTKL